MCVCVYSLYICLSLSLYVCVFAPFSAPIMAAIAHGALARLEPADHASDISVCAIYLYIHTSLSHPPER